MNWDLAGRARSLTGIKGYVTDIDPATMDGRAVVAAYHDVYQAGRSFRMTKSDLAARPFFHRLEDSIQAHLTIVFPALALSREAQARAGLSLNRILKVLRPLRSATVTIGAQQVTAQPRIPGRSPDPPQRPRLEWSLNRYNSGQSPALLCVRRSGHSRDNVRHGHARPPRTA